MLNPLLSDHKKKLLSDPAAEKCCKVTSSHLVWAATQCFCFKLRRNNNAGIMVQQEVLQHLY